MAESSRFDPDFFRISFQRQLSNTPRDAALYALGIGACAQNAMDMKELKYVYHENGQQFIQVLPTFAAVFPLGSTLEQLPGLMQFDPRLLLHGQQYMEIYKLLPSGGCVKNKTRIAGLHDKAYPVKEAVKILKTQPFATFKDHTQQSQALLYRLSGDYNLLHSDPKLAEVAGFSRSILHGLCTLGFAVRVIVRCICKGDSNVVKSISGRFLLHVYPGESLVTEMWLEGLRVIYQTKVKERSRTVLSGHVDLKCLPSSL